MNPPIARAHNLTLDGSVPDWIELLPAGPDIRGADGRTWTLPDPAAVVAAFEDRAAPLVVDWEHASEHRARHGLDAPAAGWIDRLQVRNGAVWGRVTWTEKAAAQIAGREYRFLSPVFTYEKAGARIVQLISVGLTNQPNLPLTALNREESPMSFPTAVCKALGLAHDADEADVLTAIAGLNTDLAAARNRAEAPALERFVPRADYDAALARASNAEQRLTAIEAERRAASIQTLLDRALAERKIVPATVDYYRAMCQTQDGIAQFEAFLTQAPAIIGAGSGPNAAPAPTGTPEAEFAANAALRAEFGDLETYMAYYNAAETGRATILGSKAQ
jgi:phage I-like protein